VRLLLDAMCPPAIAAQLRRRGHDVDAVAARGELRSLPDDEVFALAQIERRAMVTDNVIDYLLLAQGRDTPGEAHHGVILVDPKRHPRGDLHTVGRLVTALDELLARHRSDEATSLRYWL
jgi:hypothetical protein